MAYQWLATLALAVVLVSGQVDIRGELKNCLQDGQDLNKCLRGLADSFKPYMKTGFPELGIPKAEPLYIDAIKFELKNALADVVVDFTDTDVSGLSEHELIYIRADKEKKTIASKIFVPNSIATGNYVINGQIAVLDLEPFAPSPYRTEFTNTTLEGVAQLEVQNGKLVISGDPDISIQVGGLNIKMENLFGGKADSLARTVDKFLNQNSDKFIKDFQPQIAKSVSGFMKGFYNSAVANIDLDAFE
eukprot:GFUD01007205.1.p1 GENE.GFUD01007205.1~~GFUD01007205.1.p1  ORF type:complete len:259 (-),score=56.17 GFUD01007205.1:150-887(-)